MKRRFSSIILKTKAVLCLILTLNLSIWAMGCGQAGASLLGERTISLTADHPLTALLKGTAFEGATAVVVNPGTQQFRLIFPDGGRQISGSYILASGQPALTTITLATAEQSVTMQLDVGKRVTRISNSQGSTWERPAEWNAADPAGTGTTTSSGSSSTPQTSPSARASAADSNAYIDANAQLMELARQIDQQNGNTDASAKTAQSSLFWVPAALLSLVFIPGGIAATLLFIFEVIAFINLIL